MTENSLSICNRALTEIAQGPLMASGDPSTDFDGTPTGIYCATIYQGAVYTILRTQDWEFSRRVLALTSTGGTAPLGWSQEYGYPSDCLRVRQVVPVLPLADPYDPQPIRWDVGDVPVTGIIDTSISLAPPGSGYAIGDTGTIVGGTGTVTATYRVLTVGGGGEVLTYAITNPGNGYQTGVPYTTAATSGAGTGLVIDVITVSFTASRVIWTDQATAKLVYTTSFVKEAEFDPLFTEDLVRYLGSILAMPVAGRPDFSRYQLEVAGKIGMGGLDRDS